MANTKARVIVGVADIEIKFPVGGAFVDAGYTEDGVIVEITTDTVDIEVEEEVVPIERVIVKETHAIIVNMAESSLFNIDKAIPGSTLSGSTITLGGGTIKEMQIQVTGINPAGLARVILVALATSVGTVSMAYVKGGKTIVPVRFEALKGSADALTIIDAT